MLFELQAIVDDLPRDCTKTVRLDNPRQRIEAARILDVHSGSFSNEILYTVTASGLSYVKKSCVPLSLACILDISPPKWLSELSGHNVLLVDDHHTPDELADLINEFIEFSHAKRLQKNYEKLIQALSKGQGLQAIADIGEEILENPIGIMDTSYKILAASKNYAFGMDLQDGKEQPEKSSHSGAKSSRLSEASVHSMHTASRHEQITHRLTPHITDKETLQGMGLEAQCSFMDCGIRIKGVLVAIVSVADSARPFHAGDLEYCKYLADLIALELQKDEFFIQNHGIAYESLLNDLLNNQINDSLQVRLRLQGMNKTLRDELRVVTVRRIVGAPNETAVPIVGQATIRQFFPGCISVIYKNSIVLLTSNDIGKMRDIDENEDFIAFLDTNQMKAGVSEAFYDPIRMGKYYQQSAKAIELGIRLHPDRSVYSYYQVSVFHGMEVCSKSISLRDLSHPVINQLNNSKSESDKELLKTLYLWLFYDRDTNRISNALHIHRSTLFYRLNKIKELLGSELDDGEMIFQLMLSFKLIEYFSSFVDQSDSYWFKHVPQTLE